MEPSCNLADLESWKANRTDTDCAPTHVVNGSAGDFFFCRPKNGARAPCFPRYGGERMGISMNTRPGKHTKSY